MIKSTLANFINMNAGHVFDYVEPYYCRATIAASRNTTGGNCRNQGPESPNIPTTGFR